MTLRSRAHRKHLRAPPRDPIAALYEQHGVFVRAKYGRCPPELAPCEAKVLDAIRADIDTAEMAEAAPAFARAEAELAPLDALIAQLDDLRARTSPTEGSDEG